MKPKNIHVAVGVIIKDKKILIAQRMSGQHLEGFWEFPGGKLEKGESAESALARELEEELSIKVERSQFLFDLEYDYPEKSVKLSIFTVSEFVGRPLGAEGQPLVWCHIDELSNYTFPPANDPIVKYLLENT